MPPRIAVIALFLPATLSLLAADTRDPVKFLVLPSGSIIVADASATLRNRTGNIFPKPRHTVSMEDRGYILSSAKWTTQPILLCWEKLTEDEKPQRKVVERAIAETWEKYSTIKFEGWNSECNERSRAIRILVNDSGALTRGLGKFIANAPRNGMVLNFTFRNWNRSCQTSANRDTCIYMIAVHEFGHALGFAHEHNRPDTPGECTKRPQGSDGDKMLTSWDADSVMNYCGPVFSSPTELATIRNLSRGDRCALQTFYGPPADIRDVEECTGILKRT